MDEQSFINGVADKFANTAKQYGASNEWIDWARDYGKKFGQFTSEVPSSESILEDFGRNNMLLDFSKMKDSPSLLRSYVYGRAIAQMPNEEQVAMVFGKSSMAKNIKNAIENKSFDDLLEINSALSEKNVQSVLDLQQPNMTNSETKTRDIGGGTPESELERINAERTTYAPVTPRDPETEWKDIEGIRSDPPTPSKTPSLNPTPATPPNPEPSPRPRKGVSGKAKRITRGTSSQQQSETQTGEAHAEKKPRSLKGVRGKAKRVTNYASTANQQNTSTEGQVEASSSTATPEVSQQTQGNTPAAETPPQQQVENGQVSGTATGQAGAASSEKGSPASGAASVQEHTSTPQEKTQGSTPATGASSEPSTYAKSIKEENDRYTKETAGFDEKRKSLLRAGSDQTEALKGLETERAVAARQHGINRIQNAMDAMQGTEAFGKLYETEHLQSSGITKTGFLTSGMHYASFTEEERNGFLKSASKELGLTAEETKELKTASSSISQAYKNIWKQQAEIKSRYGESMKLVNSKDGLANMTTEQKIKHLGLTDKQVENLRKGLPMSRTGSVVDRARGFLSSTFSGVKDFFHGRMNMSNTTSSTYGQLQEARRERQLGQALDNIIIQRAKTGKWASKQTADRLAAIKRGDAAAIYDAAHAYDGPNANKQGALLRESPAAKTAAKKAAAGTGGGGIKWKGKAGAAAAILGLGAILGTMMGHHGEQSNAQLYNPNPQPQYAN